MASARFSAYSSFPSGQRLASPAGAPQGTCAGRVQAMLGAWFWGSVPDSSGPPTQDSPGLRSLPGCSDALPGPPEIADDAEARDCREAEPSLYKDVFLPEPAIAAKRQQLQARPSDDPGDELNDPLDDSCDHGRVLSADPPSGLARRQVRRDERPSSARSGSACRCRRRAVQQVGVRRQLSRLTRGRALRFATARRAIPASLGPVVVASTQRLR